MKISRDELLGAIHKKCMDCSGGSRGEVERCLVPDCWLYPYRSARAVRMTKNRDNEQQEDPWQISMLQAM